MNDLHGILFAYHSDANLGELTRPRNTCSLPFGGRYRLIDFMLSSYVNAGISDVGLIVHESYQSLLDHVGSGKDWELSRKHGGLRILPPFGYSEKVGGEYRGNMEALAGIYTYLQNIRQEYVIMGWGDIAVNLPVAEVFQQHQDTGADVTVVCTKNLKGAPRSTSYITVGGNGQVCDMSINPPSAEEALESLEVYVVSKKLLLDMVDYCSAHNLHSFGRGVLLPRLNTLKIVPYVHNGYVARFQSVSGYFERSMDLLDPAVRDDLFNPARPVRTKDMSNPSTYYGPDSKSINSLVADGCFIEGTVTDCILFPGVRVARGAQLSRCIVMQDTCIAADAILRNVIADKNVRIGPAVTLTGCEALPIVIPKGSEL